MKDLYEKLSAPFTTTDINGRVIPAHKWKMLTRNGVCVPYIDARQVAERLNQVIGVDNWSDTLIETNGNGMICEITINVGDKVITHSNIGMPSEYEREKGMASDAFKRAATKFGIGAYLYEIQPVTVPTIVKNGKKVPATNKGIELKDGEALSSYINSMHPLTMKLVEIYKALSPDKQKEHKEIFGKIMEDLK